MAFVDPSFSLFTACFLAASELGTVFAVIMVRVPTQAPRAFRIIRVGRICAAIYLLTFGGLGLYWRAVLFGPRTEATVAGMSFSQEGRFRSAGSRQMVELTVTVGDRLSRFKFPGEYWNGKSPIAVAIDPSTHKALPVMSGVLFPELTAMAGVALIGCSLFYFGALFDLRKRLLASR